VIKRDPRGVLVLWVAAAGFLLGLLLYVYIDSHRDNPRVPAATSVEEDVAPAGAVSLKRSLGVDEVDKPSPPMLAIVVDDFGYGRRGTTAILELPYSLTVSVLPNLNLTRSDYQKAIQSRHQVMLHLPMEPLNDDVSPGEDAILVGMTDDEIRGAVEKCLEQVPLATAVNNHMGSRATADADVMMVVLTTLKERGLYWVDSSTTPDSKGPLLSRLLGMPVVINNMFLDWESTGQYIENRLRDAAARARDRGYAVAIGHVSEIFAESLAAVLPDIVDSGVSLVTVDQLVDYLSSASAGASTDSPV
jgi:polysaccharide deacetylase 2 family uncharacterized protein YibQ